jgi:hypothetical protein
MSYKKTMKDEIMDMTFAEICERVKIQYNNILPESAYDSPESLVQALAAIEKDKGYRNRYNVTAFMILQACVRMPKLIFTVADIAEYTGLSKYRISECIRRWIKYNFRYLTRLPKRRGLGGAYHYKLRKHGFSTYLSLKKHILRGFALNRMRGMRGMRYIPKKIDGYFYITEVGRAKGLTQEDLPQIIL